VSLGLVRLLFQQAMPPAGSFACEVWGVRKLPGDCERERKSLARTHLQLWRRLLRVSNSVHREIVLRELGVRSPESVWLRSVCRFWNALVAAPEGSLQRAVALSDWEDATCRNVENWTLSLLRCLSDLGYPITRQRMVPIDVAAVMALHDARTRREVWEACDVCPRTCASTGARVCKYYRWFALPDNALHNPFTSLPLGLSQIHKVIRFRLGCHALPIVAQQHRRTARAERLCLHCDQGALGDEYHLLFECPATQAAREPYAHLFPQGCTMLDFIRNSDTMAVARCILACLAVVEG